MSISLCVSLCVFELKQLATTAARGAQLPHSNSSKFTYLALDSSGSSRGAMDSFCDSSRGARGDSATVGVTDELLLAEAPEAIGEASAEAV